MNIRPLLNLAASPQKLFFKIWKKLGVGSYPLRLDYDVVDRPHYAFCVLHGVRTAKQLGYEEVSIAEFGVAGGRGLIALEDIVSEVEKIYDVKVRIFGFDTGEGLPEPDGYRDMPYIWQHGFFKMDKDALQKKLKRSELVFGNVSETVPTFFKTHDAPPLAAAFFDLDYWSSTNDAFKIFQSDSNLLPRIYCYMDDVHSSEYGGIMCDYVGQLASIKDYNSSNEVRKIAKIAGIEHFRARQAAWNDQIYVHHSFHHPEYNTYIHPDRNRQLEI